MHSDRITLDALMRLEKSDIELLGELIGLDRARFSAPGWRATDTALELWRQARVQNCGKALDAEVAARFPAMLQSTTEQPWQGGNPYRGLSAFGPDDRTVFFGRETESRRLLAKLVGNTETKGADFVIVVGPSGVGKSSLVGAGLIPLLADHHPCREWVWARMTPAESVDGPIGGLAATLTRALGLGGADYAINKQKLWSAMAEPRGLRDVIEGADLPSTFLLWIDQFEELYSGATPAARPDFTALLAEGVRGGRLKVVITLRAEFYPRLLEEAGGVAPFLEGGHFPLLPPDEVAVAHMVEGPAALAGTAVEPALLATIIADMGDEPGSLPLMEFALADTFIRSQDSGRGDGTLRREDYLGLQSLIDGRADAAVASVKGLPDDTLEKLFAHLVSVVADQPPARRRVSRVAAAKNDPHLDALISMLVAERLLVSDSEADGTPTIEVAHEAVLRHWGRFRTWIEGHRESLVARSRMESAFTQWIASGRHDDYLLPPGRPLREAQYLLSSGAVDLDQDCIRFITLSARRASRSRRRLLTAGVAALVAMAILTVVSFTQWQTVREQRNDLQQAKLEAEHQAERAREGEQKALSAQKETEQARQEAEHQAEKARQGEQMALSAQKETEAVNRMVTDTLRMVVASTTKDEFAAKFGNATSAQYLKAIVNPLIDKTESMKDEEREYWRQLLPIMTDEQVAKLVHILSNERVQLSDLDDKYNAEVSKLGSKAQALSEVERERSVKNLLAAARYLASGSKDEAGQAAAMVKEAMGKGDTSLGGVLTLATAYETRGDFRLMEETLDKRPAREDKEWVTLAAHAKGKLDKYQETADLYQTRARLTSGVPSAEASVLSLWYKKKAGHFGDADRSALLALPQKALESFASAPDANSAGTLSNLSWIAGKMLADHGDVSGSVRTMQAAAEAIEQRVSNKAEIGHAYTSLHVELSYTCLFIRDWSCAEKSGRAGVAAEKQIAKTDRNDSIANMEMNAAHALLLRGDASAAKRAYLAWKGHNFSGSSFGELVAKDFAKLRNAGISSPEMDGIVAMLRR